MYLDTEIYSKPVYGRRENGREKKEWRERSRREEEVRKKVEKTEMRKEKEEENEQVVEIYMQHMNISTDLTLKLCHFNLHLHR